MWRTAGDPAQVGDVVARATLVVSPVLAFRVFPGIGGLPSLAMLLPLMVLVATYVTTRDNRVPVLELVLIGILCVSVMWSDDPNYSVERLRTYLPLLLCTVVAAALVPKRVVMTCLEIAVAVIIAHSLFRLAHNPDHAFRVGPSDVVVTAGFSKNVYGGLLSIALLLALRHRHRLNWVLVPGLVLLLVLNRTVTAWVVLSFLLLASLISRRLIAKFGPAAARPFIMLLGLVGVGGAGILASTDFDSTVESLGKDPTLGQRTDIWAACWIQIKDAPILGHGAFDFLDAASDSAVTQFVWSRFQGYHPPHPHNGLLDLWGQVGLVGVAAFFAMVTWALSFGTRSALLGDESARTVVLILVFLVIFGVTEPTYLNAWLTITLMCVAIAMPGPRDRSAPVVAARYETPGLVSATPSG